MRANDLLTSKMDEEQIVAQMRTIISAGYETVSAIISVRCLFIDISIPHVCIQWLLYELAQRPLLQATLRTEIMKADDLSFDQLNRKYPLLDASIKETLRLHPPVLENHHEVRKVQLSRD